MASEAPDAESIRIARSIPWSSFGRNTVASRVGKSLLPIGIFNFDLPKYESDKPIPTVTSRSAGFENYLINIVGTAIQAGDAKLVTCAHVIEGVLQTKRKGYVLASSWRTNALVHQPYPFSHALRYIDPRTNEVNAAVDLAVVPLPARNEPHLPYDVPIVQWGDSTKLGVGDPVLLAGFPYGTQLFRMAQTNRGVVQPSFFDGVISAIIPATKPSETRLLQISAAVAGGISGGAVIDIRTGGVVGMVTSGLTGPQGYLHPVTYAIPSEIIYPYTRRITFQTTGGVRGIDDWRRRLVHLKRYVREKLWRDR